MFGHWVVLDVTATWWSVTRGAVCRWGRQPPCGSSALERPLAPGHSGRVTVLSQPSPCRPPHQPSSAFYTQSLEPALPSWWVWRPPQHCSVGTSGKGALQADPSSAGLCWPIGGWSWFGSSRDQAACTEHLWNQSLSVRELKWIMEQCYSHYCSWHLVMQGYHPPAALEVRNINKPLNV